MKPLVFLAAILISGLSLLAQSPQAAPSTPTQSTVSAPGNPLLADLDKLQSAATQTSLEIGRMRIEKWKTDTNSKQQAQANADSIQRNVTSALPSMINAVRTAPQDLSAQFRLYRNVNALYDVLTSLTESVGAFGPKSDYEALARQLELVDSVRHDLGDSIEQLTAFTQAEMNQLRQQVQLARQAAAAAAAPPKTVIVDDNQPTPKPTTAHKKKPAAKKPPTAPGSTDSSNPAPSGDAKQ